MPTLLLSIECLLPTTICLFFFHHMLTPIPSIECLLFFVQSNVFFLPPYAYSSSITCLLLSLPLNAYSSSFSRMSSSYHYAYAYSSSFHHILTRLPTIICLLFLIPS